MATTREALRGLLLDAIGLAPFSGNASRTTSGAGNAGGTTVVDTALADYGDDYFSPWWVILPDGPSGSGSYAAQQVSTANNSFVSSTGTLTVARAFSAQVASGAAYELSRHNPVHLHAALNQASRLTYPQLYVAKRDETLVVDNRLLNWDFETYSSGFTNWTEVPGAGAILNNTTYKWHGAQGARLTAAVNESCRMWQSIVSNPFEILEITGKSVEFKAKVWCAVASVARIGLSFDGGSTFTWSDYHTGAQQWETLSVSGGLSSTSSSVRCYLNVTAGGISRLAYFDRAYASIGDIYRYTIPSSIIEGPTRVSYENDQDVAEGQFVPVFSGRIEQDGATRYLFLPSGLPAGAILRLEGYGALSTTTTDAGTVEVDSPQTETLVAAAAWRLFEMLDADATGQETDYKQKAKDWKARYGELIANPGMRHPRQGQQAVDRWALSGGVRAW